MAMQAASNAPAHGKTGSTGSNPYPLPASPTLTNPDMILPDYDDTASSPDRSQSPLIMWKNAHQFVLDEHSFPSGPVTPTTPIIYGNGTMLSDIGEVTEAESTTGPPKRRLTSRNGYAQHDAAAQSSPTVPGYQPAKKNKSEPKMLSQERERRLSIESTSTITNGDQPGLFADFDDAVSVDDSNFQGDDEESVAESYVYDDAVVPEKVIPESTNADSGFGAGTQERYSTALSRRAEQILANAKRRLTTMEGNLSRARTSLSIDSGSTPSPPLARPATATHRDHDPDFPQNPHGHSRVSSENNIDTDSKSNTLFSTRSSSALGAAGGYRQPLQSSRSIDHIREVPRSHSQSPKGNSIYGNASFAKSKTSIHDSKYTLEPLSENEVPENFSSSRSSLEDSRLDTFLSPTFGSFSDRGLKRSASTAQMRDIKDQVKDLKGRLSTLRDQARADSMKRRSLQSLRTPSPFTHAQADRWHINEKNEVNDTRSIIDEVNRWNGEVSSLHEGSIDSKLNRHESEPGDNSSIISGSVYSEHESPPQTRLNPPESHFHPPNTDMSTTLGPVEAEDEDDISDMQTEDGYQENENTDLEDEMSESGESSYEDSVQNQVSHEDREDAFDYEHFFLHSAMGSMSQKKLERRGSRDSYTSEDSVETTRGPITTNHTSGGNLVRRGSDASTSTMESFATATEGSSGAEVDDNESDEDVHNNIEDFPQENEPIEERSRSRTQETGKRPTSGITSGGSNPDLSQYRVPLTRRPQSSAATFKHRPSVSSLGSTGTNRSFPLVNRPRTNGVLTPRDSPDQELKHISETLMSETASICDRDSIRDGDKPIEMLQKDEQILVERLVASLGRCVLGMTENGRASSESRMFRRRIETARRILEGFEQSM